MFCVVFGTWPILVLGCLFKFKNKHSLLFLAGGWKDHASACGVLELQIKPESPLLSVLIYQCHQISTSLDEFSDISHISLQCCVLVSTGAEQWGPDQSEIEPLVKESVYTCVSACASVHSCVHVWGCRGQASATGNGNLWLTDQRRGALILHSTQTSPPEAIRPCGFSPLILRWGAVRRKGGFALAHVQVVGPDWRNFS